MPENINRPALWLTHLPVPHTDSHKYSRGCAMVFGGRMTGAGTLAARATQRAGAGIVHLVTPADLMPIYAGNLLSCVIRAEPYEVALEEERVSAYLIGPGHDVSEETRLKVLAILAKGKPTVLDAGALSSFKENPERLFAALHPHSILTPHAGEFASLFGKASLADAVTTSGAIVVRKGAETAIGAAGTAAIINRDAPADLASAGTGDVLAGLITGLLAQGMPAFLAAAAGVWLHSEAARRIGAGLIAEDIEGQIPAILAELRKLRA